MERNASLDHIRIGLTALVVFHHTALVYGGSGSWYWREQPDASNTVLVIFNCINQSFFMGFFFLLAGYFSAAALARKSTNSFLWDRVVRLGLPLLAYYFLLSPFTIALASYADGDSFFSSLSYAWQNKLFGPGPLWFVAALLSMSIGYLLLRRITPKWSISIQSLPSYFALLGVITGLGLVSFSIRIWLPVGEEVLWMQLGYFAPYIFLFAVGVLSHSSHLLERITLQQCKPWFITSFVALLLLGWALTTRWELGGFNGGWNLNALFYALWDPLFSTGVMLGMLWSFRRWAGRASALSRIVARRAYAVFIIHPPVVVFGSALASHLSMGPLVKLIIVGSFGVLSCLALASLLLLVPGVKRVL